MTSTDSSADPAAPQSAFHSLSEYVALPRLGGLALSPAADRLTTTVSSLSPDGKTYVGSLWQLDPSGADQPRRLTRGTSTEGSPAYLPDGTLLFTAKRKDPEDKDAAEVTGLWALPAGGGEATLVVARAGDVGAVAVARESGTVVVGVDVLPGADPDDADRRKARDEAGVTAILHETYPVRHWDHDLGPGEPRLLFLDAPGAGRAQTVREIPLPERSRLEDHALSPDGKLLAATLTVPTAAAGASRSVILVVDTADGTERFQLDAGEDDFDSPTFRPDGGALLCLRHSPSSYDDPPIPALWELDLRTGTGRGPSPDLTLWPHAPAYSSDGAAAYFVADEQGRAPVFRVDLADGTTTRLTSAGAHSDLAVAADGSAIYAMRSGYDAPPHPVRLDPRTADQDGVPVPAPGDVGPLPGTLTEITTPADDGVPIRSWLVLPEGATTEHPAPLLLWIHGGPVMSWTGWSWRWNPWLMAARGYAVLLPDPALSTGYGVDFVKRGWGAWGARPFTDLMTATDACCARPDIDESRTAAMGGSFGGYMANWVATHTDRFSAIVTHASLWALDQFSGTTDLSFYWQREFGDPDTQPDRYDANSPHRYADAITTPMLVVHGDRDYRVPIGEGLRLWWDLRRRDIDAKFLYFPSENHWVLTPGNARVWYETVDAFLARHVLGLPWQRPTLL
ncbi:MAG: prolyl oligopeptidase family serine peptidase [Mycobacteriales bacterium]